MPNLFRNSWPALWTPNQDDINGDPRGLLRADNLTQEQDGVLSLIRGTKQVSSGPFGSWVTDLFSRMMNYQSGKAKLRYAASGNYILRNYSPAQNNEVAFDLVITNSGMANALAAFGFGSGHIFICYGAAAVKDDGTNQTPIGMPAPDTAPGAIPILAPSIDLSPGGYTQWEVLENNTIFNATANYVEIDADPDLKIAIAMRGLTNAFSLDTTALGGTVDSDTPDDIFSVSCRIADTTKFVKFTIVFQLRQPTDETLSPDATDYYQYEWTEDGGVFNPGINAWSKIQCLRSDFERIGTDSTLTWKNVKGIKITYSNSEPVDGTFVLNNMKFEGGVKGALNGTYTYVQVDVQDNTFYQEKSLPSANSIEVNVLRQGVTVIPRTVQGHANQCWIYRKGGKLEQYYRIKKIDGTNGFGPAPFEDNISDDDAKIINIPLDTFQANLPPGIIGMECNWKGRNWYITFENLYPSYRDNPSSYDSRFVIETAGKNAELNYFITRLSNDTMILATSGDFYEITGTANLITEQDIDFFDINIRPLGIQTPTISTTFAVREGNLFYLASDGIRVLSGSSCTLLIQPIDLLFKGYNRYGIAPVRISLNLGDRYYLIIAKNRLYFSAVQTDSRRPLYVYSFEDKTWRYEDHGDTDSFGAMFSEEDDTIIYSTADFGDKFLRILDTGTLYNQTNNINFKFLTVFDCNEQPRNRKDSYSLKISADTGANDVTVTLRGFTGLDKTSDQNQTRTFTTTLNFNSKQEQIINIYSAIGLVKYYQLEISGTVSFFKLYNFSIDYDPRPEQLSMLRIPPSQFGIAGRKRLQEIPFVIDTLGNIVHFAPILDGAQQAEQIFVNTDKGLCTYFFTGDTSAFNIGALLSGTLFEFYELIQPREIELLPDPARYKLIPFTNFGNGSRKRFIQYAVTVDTRGVNVNMTPNIDGVNYPTQIINTNYKKTVIYTFDSFAVGVDIACVLQGSTNTNDPPFECYGINLSECISEKLPPLASHYHIPYTNFNTSARKRMQQFAFVINTFGFPVQFTPLVDGASEAPINYITTRKQTVIYTFSQATVGVDFGGLLEGTQDFEYYGPNLEESIYEKLPALAKVHEIAITNFGSAAKKRVRTIPIVIDTFGSNVTFTPSADGVNYPSSTINTIGKRTALHYFDNRNNPAGIPFAIDYGGTLQGTNEFEFYEVLKPEIVEILPVGKMFDQFGPVEFSKVGKIRQVSIYLMATGTSFNFNIFASDIKILTGTVNTVPYTERTYPIDLPKGINPNVFRMEIWSDSVFHRFDSAVRVNVDGNQTENKIIKIK